MAAALSAANVKLGKQLGAIRRELVANPKKTAVLLVLLAAAAWFWGPILWRRFGGRSTAAPATAQSATGGGQPSAVSVDIRLFGTDPIAGKTGKPMADWRQLLAARRRDPLAKPAVFDSRWPQPFKAPDLATSLAGGTDPAGQPALPFSPAEVGLVLESIVYGKSNKMAVINGEVYREGSEVAVATAQGPPVSFQLLRIERNRVAMKRHDREYWLEFPRPKLTGSDRIEASHSSATPPQQDQP